MSLITGYRLKNKLFQNKALLVLVTLIGTAGLSYWIKDRYKAAKLKQQKPADDSTRKRPKAAVDKLFFIRLYSLSRIAVPSFFCRESLELWLLIGFLWARTHLTLCIADITGKNAKSLVSRNYKKFIQGVLNLAAVAIPASIVNSGIKYWSFLLRFNTRQRISEHLHDLYLNDLTFYRAANMEKIDNIDQRITQDIDKFAESFASLFGTIFKPFLDIILLTSRLVKVVGYKGSFIMYFYYLVSSIILHLIMPPYARLTAELQRLEGNFRHLHSRVINYSEEIAFYRGIKTEKEYLDDSFNCIYDQSKYIFQKQASLGIFDSWLVKYGSTLVGYVVLAIPVFGTINSNAKNSDTYSVNNITRDYVSNSHILINLARSIGKIVLLYKNFTQLAGYTTRVAELRELLLNINAEENEADKKDIYEYADRIEFKHVDIISPDNIVLLQDVTFSVYPGTNLLIVGPNGSGKSSLFRVLSNIWPLSNGHLVRPRGNDIFYIPQRPYFTSGTFREQVLYPHSEVEMKSRGITDDDLASLLEQTEIKYLLDRESWERKQDWTEKLSQGEQQRLAMARLFYHSPKFAILDECTSQLSLDIEALIFSKCKNLDITLITVAHRKSLWKYHSHVLILDGLGNWTFRQINSEDLLQDNNQIFNQ